MLYKFFIALATLLVVNANAPSERSVHISTNTDVDGLNGLNLNWQVPFKVDDYVVGFRYKLNELKKYPETLFAKKTFDVADGEATVDADVNVDDKSLSANVKWVSDKLVDGMKTTLRFSGNSNEKITSIGAEINKNVDGRDVELKGTYNLGDSRLDANGKVVVDKTTAEVSYNSGDEDIRLQLSHDLDDHNTPKGSYSTKTGQVAYGWTRKWEGGELDGTYHPDNGGRAVLEWTDKGNQGDWKTRAEVPLANNEIGNSRVTIKREWKY